MADQNNYDTMDVVLNDIFQGRPVELDGCDFLYNSNNLALRIEISGDATSEKSVQTIFSVTGGLLDLKTRTGNLRVRINAKNLGEGVKLDPKNVDQELFNKVNPNAEIIVDYQVGGDLLTDGMDIATLLNGVEISAFNNTYLYDSDQDVLFVGINQNEDPEIAVRPTLKLPQRISEERGKYGDTRMVRMIVDDATVSGATDFSGTTMTPDEMGELSTYGHVVVVMPKKDGISQKLGAAAMASRQSGAVLSVDFPTMMENITEGFATIDGDTYAINKDIVSDLSNALVIYATVTDGTSREQIFSSGTDLLNELEAQRGSQEG